MSHLEAEDAQVRAKMQELGKLVDKQLPYGWAYVVLCFNFGEGGRMNYVANAKRRDVVRAMYEFIEATKAQYGEHEATMTEKDDDEALGRARQRIAELERERERPDLASYSPDQLRVLAKEVVAEVQRRIENNEP
jgi:hypothetical protein